MLIILKIENLASGCSNLKMSAKQHRSYYNVEKLFYNGPLSLLIQLFDDACHVVADPDDFIQLLIFNSERNMHMRSRAAIFCHHLHK